MPLNTLTIISILALLMSGFIFIKDYLLSAKVQVFFGDSIQISCREGGVENEKKLILNCNFTNIRNHLGVINGSKLQLLFPNGNMHEFNWKIFCRWERLNATHDGLPRSVPVLAKSSIFQIIIFVSEENFSWVKGKYKLSFRGWYNKEPYKNDSNINKTIYFSLDEQNASEINKFLTTGEGNIETRSIRIFNS
ncbi:MAG: hypothetical protein ABIG10_01555 [bacterium]